MVRLGVSCQYNEIFIMLYFLLGLFRTHEFPAPVFNVPSKHWQHERHRKCMLHLGSIKDNTLICILKWLWHHDDLKQMFILIIPAIVHKLLQAKIYIHLWLYDLSSMQMSCHSYVFCALFAYKSHTKNACIFKLDSSTEWKRIDRNNGHWLHIA